MVLAPLINSAIVTQDTLDGKTKAQVLAKPKTLVDSTEKKVDIRHALVKLAEKEKEKKDSGGKESTKEEKNADTRNALGLPANHPVPTGKNPVVVIQTGEHKGKEIFFKNPRGSVWHEYFWAIYEGTISLPLIFFGHVGWPWLRIPTGFLMGYQVTQFAEWPLMKVFDFGE